MVYPNISASDAKLENPLDDPESLLLRGSQLKNELIWLRRLGCRWGCYRFGNGTSSNSGTTVPLICKDKSNSRKRDGRTDRRMEKRTDGWADGRTDRLTVMQRCEDAYRKRLITSTVGEIEIENLGRWLSIRLLC